MSTAIVVVEGVLADYRGSWPEALPIQVGIDLTQALSTKFDIVYATDTTDVAMHEFLRWAAPLQMMPRVVMAAAEGGRVTQVTHLRAQRWDVKLVVDSDPREVLAVRATGIASLLFAHPTLTPPEDDPDGEAVESWDELVDKVSRKVSSD